MKPGRRLPGLETVARTVRTLVSILDEVTRMIDELRRLR